MVFSDFSIDAILGLRPEQKTCGSISPSRNSITSSPRSSTSSSEDEFEPNPLEIYLKSIALQQIQIAKLHLLPPKWSQRQQNSTSAKPRKYTKDQTVILIQKYLEKTYVNREEMQELADKTGLSMLQVKIWFQNRRLKDRKMTKRNI